MGHSALDGKRMVRIGDIDMCYSKRGSSAQTMLLVHGFPLNHQMWRRAEPLCEKFTLLAPDLRGFGDSTRGEKEASFQQYADDLLGFIHETCQSPVVACGFSMGGYVLMHAMLKEPKLFRAAIFANTQCIADPMIVKQKRYETIRKLETEGLSAFADEFVANVFSDSTYLEQPGLVEEVREIILQADMISVKDALKAMARRTETCSGLKRLQIPSMVVCGDEEKLISRHQSEFLYNCLARSVFRIISGTGHLSCLEKPEQFNRKVLQFVDSL